MLSLVLSSSATRPRQSLLHVISNQNAHVYMFYFMLMNGSWYVYYCGNGSCTFFILDRVWRIFGVISHLTIGQRLQCNLIKCKILLPVETRLRCMNFLMACGLNDELHADVSKFIIIFVMYICYQHRTRRVLKVRTPTFASKIYT